MTLENLERLEERITTLTEKFVELKQNHEKALSELSVRDQRIDELNDNSRIENILKRLEVLKTQQES